MARTSNKLKAKAVAALTKPGRHSDGNGLYLSIDGKGGRRWVLLFTWHGRTREMGLGSGTAVSLARARELAADARRLLAEGKDPIAARRGDKAHVATFGAVADDLMTSLESGWRNPKHRAQWKMTLSVYAAPLRGMPVDTISTEVVLAVLKPLWTTKPETASRLRGRIERVLDAARVRDLRQGENPARWRGHLDHLLPKPGKLTRGHHEALAIDAMPAFLERLQTRPSIASKALAFTILTAARSGEVLGARWTEIDLDNAVWTVPAARMKTGKPHLSNSALAVLREMHALRTVEVDLVFPGQKRGRPLSVMAFSMLLRRMKVEVTAHGFRSSFRDWAAERNSCPHEVAEMALAHAIGSKTEAAYRRGDLFEKRRQLMAAWADFLTGESKQAVPSSHAPARTDEGPTTITRDAGPPEAQSAPSGEGGDAQTCDPRNARLRRFLLRSLHRPQGPHFDVERAVRDCWIAHLVVDRCERGMRFKDALHDVASNWSTLKKEAPELALKGPLSEAAVRRAYDLYAGLFRPGRGRRRHPRGTPAVRPSSDEAKAITGTL